MSAEIGAMLAGQAAGAAGVPLPSLTGGDAGQSGASAGTNKSTANIFATSSSGSGLWLSIALIVGAVVWLKIRKSK